jgi:hypothetical protein
MTCRRQDTGRCPDCGVPLVPHLADSGDGRPDGDPLREATLLLRLTALAKQAGVVDVFDMSVQSCAGLAGAIAIGIDKDGNLRATIGLADDLNDELRADVLAFGVAVFVGEPTLLTSRPNGLLGLGRERLLPAKRGPGHLAWHMLYSCGRTTVSATFEVVPIDASVG